MTSILPAAHILICLFLILIILVQQGKGADVGATFGGGGSTLFGSSGADSLLTKVTAYAAAFFMFTSILLAVSANESVVASGRLMDLLPENTPEAAAPDAEIVSIPEPEKADSAGSAESAPATATSETPAAATQATTAAKPATDTAAPPAETAPATPAETAQPTAEVEESAPPL